MTLSSLASGTSHGVALTTPSASTATRIEASPGGEVKAGHSEISAYALSRLQLGPAYAVCLIKVTEHLIETHTDGAYAVLRFNASCAVAPVGLDVTYKFLFDVDPQYRGLLNLSIGDKT